MRSGLASPDENAASLTSLIPLRMTAYLFSSSARREILVCERDVLLRLNAFVGFLGTGRRPCAVGLGGASRLEGVEIPLQIVRQPVHDAEARGAGGAVAPDAGDLGDAVAV